MMSYFYMFFFGRDCIRLFSKTFCLVVCIHISWIEGTLMNFNHKRRTSLASFTISDIPIYSASVVNSEVEICFLLQQLNKKLPYFPQIQLVIYDLVCWRKSHHLSKLKLQVSLLHHSYIPEHSSEYT